MNRRPIGCTAHDIEMWRSDGTWHSANQGNVIAQFNVGRMYELGLGVPADHQKAVEWYRKAAEQGHAEAAYKLSDLMFEHDRAESVRWLCRAANGGHAEAQGDLGYMHQDGYGEEHGVARDDIKAAEWYRKAADEGNAEGQYSLGSMYSFGEGVPQDDAQGMAWFTRAAEQGHAEAQKTLGDAYSAGRGVARDDARAFAWFRKAAEQGHARAQKQVAHMYSNGQGVPQDSEQAHIWSRKAADQLHAEAAEHANILRKSAGQGAALGRSPFAPLRSSLPAVQISEKADMSAAPVRSAVKGTAAKTAPSQASRSGGQSLDDAGEDLRRRLAAELIGDAKVLNSFKAADEKAASPLRGFERGLSDGSPFRPVSDLSAWSAAERQIARRKERSYDSDTWGCAVLLYPFVYVSGWLFGVLVKVTSNIISLVSGRR